MQNDTTPPRIAVVGAGAVGGYYGAKLHAAGGDVLHEGDTVIIAGTRTALDMLDALAAQPPPALGLA